VTIDEGSGSEDDGDADVQHSEIEHGMSLAFETWTRPDCAPTGFGNDMLKGHGKVAGSGHGSFDMCFTDNRFG
jgi:hypothetical protein